MENQNYFIYKLNVLDEFYIGSTKNPVLRFKSHKHDSRQTKHKDKKLYKKMNQVYDYKDTDLLNYTVLECLNCNVRTAREREQYYIDTLKPTLNSINAIKDPEEYRMKAVLYAREKREKETEAQHQLRLAKKKVWYWKNREDILARERMRYKEKKIEDMKQKLEMIKSNIECLESQNDKEIELNLDLELEEVDINDIKSI